MAGWFARFFETLQPTTGESLSLQEEIMQTFTSSYTKPVNIMLQQLKSIADEEGFRYQEFIERATILFFSSPKNSLLTIYSIFEKIVAQHSEMKEPCCITLCQLFLKKDESLQKKAANFYFKVWGMPLRPISKKHYSLINRRCFKACKRYSHLSSHSL
mgnify:CR=1 FL=1